MAARCLRGNAGRDRWGRLSPLTRWLFAAFSLAAVAILTATVVAAREKANSRASRLFDLSNDMLCAVNGKGYLVELNAAWEHCLGYGEDELRADPVFNLVHPDDREPTKAALAGLFAGRATIDFENRLLAKDGSWHWLRWRGVLDAGGSLIYARASDQTDLKRVEYEREDLLIEVEILARSDPLTGLPNRRALDEQLPREMARARRSGGSLCVAVIDIDQFKVFNDRQGHIAGDGMLRECAVAWDSKLRGEDSVIRYGGERFLVVLPDCSLEDGAEIVERLRKATPNAGDLLGRPRLLGSPGDDGRASRAGGFSPLSSQARGARSPHLQSVGENPARAFRAPLCVSS